VRVSWLMKPFVDIETYTPSLLMHLPSEVQFKVSGLEKNWIWQGEKKFMRKTVKARFNTFIYLKTPKAIGCYLGDQLNWQMWLSSSWRFQSSLNKPLHFCSAPTLGLDVLCLALAMVQDRVGKVFAWMADGAMWSKVKWKVNSATKETFFSSWLVMPFDNNQS
jgi:hypothetical protein